jgi:hypothetical protein
LVEDFHWDIAFLDAEALFTAALREHRSVVFRLSSLDLLMAVVQIDDLGIDEGRESALFHQLEILRLGDVILLYPGSAGALLFDGFIHIIHFF